MREIVIGREVVNVEVLHQELAIALPGSYQGLSTARGQVRVHVADDIDAATIARVRDVVQQHDPSVLSRQQQERLALTQLRETFNTSLDVQDFAASPNDVQQLAQRLNWIERELRQLLKL